MKSKLCNFTCNTCLNEACVESDAILDAYRHPQKNVKYLQTVLNAASTYLVRREYTGKFYCKALDIPIYTVCEADKCQFFINFPSAKNCLWEYINSQNIKSLSLEEIAYLLKKPLNKIQGMFRIALNKLRIKMFECIINEHKQCFSYVKNDKICCVCEERLDSQHYKAADGLYYCSEACKQEKPPVVIYLENKFHLPIKELLNISIKALGTITTTATFLNVSRAELKNLVRKYADYKLKDEREKPCVKLLELQANEGEVYRTEFLVLANRLINCANNLITY